MSTISIKLISAGLFFLFIFLSGSWLSHTGKPYGMFIITIHKLIGLATGAYLGINVYLILRSAPISIVETTAIVFTVLFFIGLVATGGLISTERPVPEAVAMFHKLFPYLTVFSTGVTIYLLS